MKRFIYLLVLSTVIFATSFRQGNSVAIIDAPTVEAEPVDKEEIDEEPIEEEVVIEEPIEEEVVEPEPEVIFEGEELYKEYTRQIGAMYNIDPILLQSIMWHESRMRPDTTTGNCVGLMQVNTEWHIPRANKLGVTNLYDPYGNILVATDYLAELYGKYQDMDLVLMLYSTYHDEAFALHRNGQVSWYVESVYEHMDMFR